MLRANNNKKKKNIYIDNLCLQLGLRLWGFCDSVNYTQTPARNISLHSIVMIENCLLHFDTYRIAK